MGNHVDSSSSSLESGYASGESSTVSLPSVVLTKQHLKFLNNTLNNLDPIDILRWCKITFPNLYQSTAFGVSGLVTLDMLSKIQAENPSGPTVDAIFLDTLYHFQETHALIEKTKQRYPNVTLHIYKPKDAETTAEFEARHGKELWKTNDTLYDWVAKVEPGQRAYSDLCVTAVLTGRRRSQGAKRDSLDIIEVDEAGLIKINPLASWSFKQVKDYITKNNVPYNELLDRGYKSVGDWHSTEPVKEGEDERAGRWKGQGKTECGIHNPKSIYAQYLQKMDLQKQQEDLVAALATVEVQSPTPSPEQTTFVLEMPAEVEPPQQVQTIKEIKPNSAKPINVQSNLHKPSRQTFEQSNISPELAAAMKNLQHSDQYIEQVSIQA